nr:hypothetical protein [uncultured Cohaesibacter sp.]
MEKYSEPSREEAAQSNSAEDMEANGTDIPSGTAESITLHFARSFPQQNWASGVVGKTAGLMWQPQTSTDLAKPAFS